MKASAQQGSSVQEQKIARGLVISRIFGGKRKELERAIREAGQNGHQPINFPNGTWLAAHHESGGTVLFIRGAKTQETVAALENNTIDRMLAGMKIAGALVRMN